MNKKILIYVGVIIILIIAGAFCANKISGDNKTVQTGTNNVDKSNIINETNELANENSSEENNNIIKPDEKETNSGVSEKKPEEKAKEIVKENWREEDDSVYYSYDGTDENGKYIICVRDKATTKALYWYYVDIDSGTFDIK